jgi:phosphoribosyl 1,2-cyclic phosphodiesterase
MKIKLWGARGSLPSPYTPRAVEKRITSVLESFVRAGHSKLEDIEPFVKTLPRGQHGGFGGNTPCVTVTSASGGTQAIIDGGTGIRLLAHELLQGPCGKGKGEVHLFFTHFHWDHLIGLPFFVPIFIPGNTIHVYSVQEDLKRTFETLFQKPYFPISLEKLGARIVYHRLEPRKPFRHGEMTLTPYQLDHPDPCWGYRLECDGKVYSHCVDTEAKRVSREELGPDLPLYQGVDLMVFDSQYSLTEQMEKVDWGHAAAEIGLDIGIRESIPRMVFVHHDPSSTDFRISDGEALARAYYEAQRRQARRNHESFPEIDFCFGHEGLEIDLD